MKTENVKGLIEILNSDARNAMHSILGFLELVTEGALDPAQKEHLAACRTAADKHLRGIEDVRVILSVVPEGKPFLTEFAPGDLFARVAEVIGLIAARKRIALFCRVDRSVPPVVSADIDRIGHALLRIAEAVVATTEGTGFHLNLQAMPSPNKTDLTFEIFAPARMLAPVFMRALRDDFEFEGTLEENGILGLVAAGRLVTALGGRVEASADSSTGTRIAVTIPVSVPSGAVTLPGHDPAAVHGAQRALRILVAEDSDDSFRLFKAYLQGQPHTVARATNGAEAVELATAESFDLLFMDIRMPVLDGYAATLRIRELETGRDRARMPIVVLSAEDLRAQRRQGALAGCSGHLSKPLRKHELLEAIRVYSIMQSSTNHASDPAPTH